ncbi:MAG: coproporphyrinogen-III oxidase family protein [Planctomycetota bacterium]
MIEMLTRGIRRHFSGSDSRYVFTAAAAPSPRWWPARTDLYLHVPFCRYLCPHCPYYKERYQPERIGPFVEAVRREAALWAARLGRCRVGSLYIGGGTPMLLGDRLGDVLDDLRERFDVTGGIGIELNPTDVTPAAVARLRRAGVNRVSLGVQSFSADSLRIIGRPYPPRTAHTAVERLRDEGFDVVNLDLMFALPGQGLDPLRRDIDVALATGADQLTFYPLFTFPHTPAGRRRGLRRLRMPNLLQRRRHYRCLHAAMMDAGLRRVSVWGFARPGRARYSSVTRTGYIGLGPGAGGHLPGQFVFNTFSVAHYQRRIFTGRFATTLTMDLTDAMERYYWLYWRLYEGRLPAEALSDHFAADRRALRWLRAARWLGLWRPADDDLRLTERGAFWIHWLQNQFILRYIATLWRVATADPFPARVEL